MKMDPIFTDHMVFAARKPIRIYGEGVGEAVLTFAGQSQSIKSVDGRWMVEFPPMEYGGPYTLEATLAGKRILLEDLYIGEVYLFAGQSNMQFKMKESNASKELYESLPALRLFSTDRIEKTDYYTSKDGWVRAEKGMVAEWSALGYLTGRLLCKEKKIAIGAIACYQGASVVESWVPKGYFEKKGIGVPPEERFHDHTTYGDWNGDGCLYEYGLKQVIPFALSGVVWYQGESDDTPEEGAAYLAELAALIDQWRKDFRDDDLPFAIVQIADCEKRDGEGWKLIQQAQAEIGKERKFVETVRSADVCETNDIHPPTKHLLAERIAEALKVLTKTE